MRGRLWGLGLCVALGLGAGLAGCDTELSAADKRAMVTPKVEAYFNYPGSNEANGINTTADDIVVQLIDRSRQTIDFAVMGFSQRTVVQALVRAFFRGVQLRFVGDAKHAFGNVLGYDEMDRLNVPFQVGNQNHIMHNKFFVFDGRIVVTGTGNITPTGFDRNDNNWVIIDSPQVAADFTAEFNQMFAGRFGYAKQRLDNGNRFQVGDTAVEIHFSPQEDTVGRMLEAIRNATHSVEFTIFAFTKDQVGAAFISKHEEFEHYNACCDPARAIDLDEAARAECNLTVACERPFVRKYVRGVIDTSQLHSNGPYHEAYRMLINGLDLRIDGNDNARQPGDYQAGGGRLHTKTMIMDAGTDHGVVLTGSFNWSSSATISNDETLMVLDSSRIARAYHTYFDLLWRIGKNFGRQWIGDDTGLKPGDVVFNEIMWDGWNGDCLHRSQPGLTVPCDDPEAGQFDQIDNDEFIELLNTTDRPIDLSMWNIANEHDFAVGLYPGTVIGPYERFLILGHNTEPYDDLRPQFRGGAYQNPDFVMNMANDARFLRMNLRNADFALRLVDPKGNVMDYAGDGGPPFAGGRSTADATTKNYSMVRVHFDCAEQADCFPIRDGRDRASWARGEQTGENVREAYRDHIFATPGEANDDAEAFPAEDPNWRSASGERDGTYAAPPRD
ncbi:MAG: lamin tail domain-containing protein [Myxococcales bacterium]|nr:lamin tail domain-containing protein [Myxococcales bacterium]